jgi:exosortase/archaeosortase family protein
MIAFVGLLIAVAFVLLNRDKISKLEMHKTKAWEMIFFGILTLISLILFYLLRFFMHNHLNFAEKLKWFFIPLIYMLIFSFGFSLFLAIFGRRFILDIFENFSKQIIPFAIASIILYLILIYSQSLWPYFSYGVSTILYNLFKLIYSDVHIVYQPTGPILAINQFSAAIGAPCSGIDSLMMFTGLFIFLFILDYPKLNKKAMLLALPIGLIGTYFLNILRIFLLFITGVYTSPKFAIGLFHQNIGWILFIIYFFLFWLIARKYVYLKKLN